MKVGDRVGLAGSFYKDETPLWPMTIVDRVSFNEDWVVCMWYNCAGEIQRGEFPKAALTKLN